MKRKKVIFNLHTHTHTGVEMMRQHMSAFPISDDIRKIQKMCVCVFILVTGRSRLLFLLSSPCT